MNLHPNLATGIDKISDPREFEVQRSPFSGRLNAPPKVGIIHARRNLSKEDLADCRAGTVAGEGALRFAEHHDAAISVELDGAKRQSVELVRLKLLYLISQIGNLKL